MSDSRALYLFARINPTIFRSSSVLVSNVPHPLPIICQSAAGQSRDTSREDRSDNACFSDLCASSCCCRACCCFSNVRRFTDVSDFRSSPAEMPDIAKVARNDQPFPYSCTRFCPDSRLPKEAADHSRLHSAARRSPWLWCTYAVVCGSRWKRREAQRLTSFSQPRTL